jgi:hypothetical protein
MSVSADIGGIGSSRRRISGVFWEWSRGLRTSRCSYGRRMRIIRADDLYNDGNDTCIKGGGVQSKQRILGKKDNVSQRKHHHRSFNSNVSFFVGVQAWRRSDGAGVWK